LKQFLKLDLNEITFFGKNKLGFGIKYKIYDETSTLYFYGTPWKNLKEKTLVVQIKSKRVLVHICQ